VIPRYLSLSLIRACALVLIAAAVVGAVFMSVRHSQPAAADPAYGSVKLNPGSGFIIQGHVFAVPVNMTTCSSSAPPPTYTSTATATNTATPTKTSTATPITFTPTSTPTATPVTFTPTRTWTPTVTQTPFPGTPLPSPTFSPSTMCRVGSYDISMNYDVTKFSVTSDGGTSTGGNTNMGCNTASPPVCISSTLVDTTKAWKLNAWAGSTVSLIAGAGADGANGPQYRRVLSNSATTLTVMPPWDGFPVSFPDNTTVYRVGGLTDAGWVASTGRPLQCPIGAVYGAGTAELHCVTLGTTNGVGGSGTLTNLTLAANNRGLAFFTFNVAPARPGTEVFTIEGNDIPADVVTGARRVTLCPDANVDNRVNSTDQTLMAKAFNQHGGNLTLWPLYTQAKDPNEDNVINSTDLSIAAGEFNERCVQQ
jgi:hypothetical protein